MKIGEIIQRVQSLYSRCVQSDDIGLKDVSVIKVYN